MNKVEFLDILQDYLTENFSESDIIDILRDYEEFFINGKLEGKSEEEICKTLGSPKNVAKELIREMKGATKEETRSFVKENLETLRKKGRIYFNKANKKAKEFLNSDSIINGSRSSSFVKTIIYIVTGMLILIGLFMIPIFIAITLVLIGGSLVNGLGYILGILLFSANNYVATASIFGSIFLTGLIILGWTIYLNIIKYIKIFIVKYRGWIKKKFMYLRASNTDKRNNSKVKNGFNKNEAVEGETYKEEGDKNE